MSVNHDKNEIDGHLTNTLDKNFRTYQSYQKGVLSQFSRFNSSVTQPQENKEEDSKWKWGTRSVNLMLQGILLISIAQLVA